MEFPMLKPGGTFSILEKTAHNKIRATYLIQLLMQKSGFIKPKSEIIVLITIIRITLVFKKNCVFYIHPYILFFE